MNDKPERMPNVPPFVRFVASAVPMVFDNSLSYYEALCALWKYIQDLTNVVNNNATLEEEFIKKVNELETYVNTYFDNLDVQEEINNKLDEMAEQGQLADIIAQYLGLAGVLAFSTVADMKNAENLVDGSSCKTAGYHSINDGGSGYYKVREVTNEDVVDEGKLIALHDNQLVAELIVDDGVNVKQLGAYGDDTHDDYAVFNYGVANFKSLTIPSGTYLVETPINLVDSVELKGIGSPVIHINTGGHGFVADNIDDIKVTAIEFTAPEDNTAQASHADHHIFKFSDCSYITIDNCKAYYGVMGFTFKNCTNITFTHNIMHHFTGWSNYFGTDLSETKNAEISGNTCYSGSYDGIKLTGYLENVKVIDNTCYDNTSDGIDYAGHTVKNVVISGNNISDCVLCGIDFKQLDRDEYPIDNTKTKRYENVIITNNTISNITGHAISGQYYYDDVNIHNILITDNVIDMRTTYSGSSGTGVRISPCVAQTPQAIMISNNLIKSVGASGYDYGVRLSDTQNVVVDSNEITGYYNTSVRIDVLTGASSNNIISNNIITNKRASSNIFDGTNTITNLTIKGNEVQNDYGGYYVNNNIIDTTGLIIYGNKSLDHYSALPTIRVTKNFIYPSVDSATSGCMGWICTSNGNGSASNMKQYITIA